MNQQQQNLLAEIDNRPLVIWGARMTGIGFLRFVEKHDLTVISYIDSDESLHGTTWRDVPINSPDRLREFRERYPNLCIVVAVALKEDEIMLTLRDMEISEGDYINYSKFCESFFTIDIVGTCNLKCPSCARSIENVSIPKGVMSIQDFQDVTKKMVKEAGVINHISLYSWGEPFIHPKLDLIIKHVHSLGIATAVSTNLSLQSSDQIKKVVRAEPDYLKISLSGYYPDTYNKTHKGGNIDLVKSNLYKLRYFIDKLKASIFVEVNYHLYKHNSGKDLEKMKALCEELGFTISPVYALVMPVERVIDYCEGQPDEQTKMVSDLLLVGIEEGIEITKEYRDKPCRFLANQINISWDKSVPVCCICFNDDTAIISNDYLNETPESINAKKNNHPLCKRCCEHGIPPYQLALNKPEWKKLADKKLINAS